MQTHLIFDIGNSKVKAAFFQNDEIIDFQKFGYSLTKIQQLIEKHSDPMLISSVVELPAEITQNRKIFFLNQDLKLPIKNNYLSPKTLGNDRLANAVAGHFLSKNKRALVIDCGTCLKFDICINGEYLGGSISPGLGMRFKALHNFTDKLPLIEVKSFDELIGKNTDESILSGCYRGMLAEIEKTIDDYSAAFKGLEIFITGGDHSLFVNPLKNRIFADPFLTLKGLNEILKHQL